MAGKAGEALAAIQPASQAVTEQAASAAKSLADMAAALRDVVARFKLN